MSSEKRKIPVNTPGGVYDVKESDLKKGLTHALDYFEQELMKNETPEETLTRRKRMRDNALKCREYLRKKAEEAEQ